jgi:hypothetical protein
MNGQSPGASSARFAEASFGRLDKLKHVPQCAARMLSAVSFQHSAFEQHGIVAACKEYGGIVIQCAARKLSAVSFQLLSGMKSSRRAENMKG